MTKYPSDEADKIKEVNIYLGEGIFLMKTVAFLFDTGQSLVISVDNISLSLSLRYGISCFHDDSNHSGKLSRSYFHTLLNT